MRIGVPKEIKVHEYRVGLTPASVAELVAHGHELVVETKAGNGIDCPDKAYEKAGATILPDAKSVFDSAEMIVKVKEPQPQEIAMLRPGQILFTYLHLAADKEQALGLMKSGAVCIAYETVTAKNGSLPLLKPMEKRIETKDYGAGFFRVILRYGFMEEIDVPVALCQVKEIGAQCKMMDTSFFLARQTLLASSRPGMAIWREKLFAWMLRNAESAMEFFKLPTNRVVELGSQLEI
jgi:hypothetical protein